MTNLASIITTVLIFLLLLFLLSVFIVISVELYFIYKERELNKYLYRMYLFNEHINELQEQLNNTDNINKQNIIKDEISDIRRQQANEYVNMTIQGTTSTFKLMNKQ
jgi:predicted PurR-regulated permease PerM